MTNQGDRSPLLWACVVVSLGLCAVAGWAQTRGAVRKPAPRVLLNMEKEYLAPVVGEDAPLKPGVAVELVFLNGKRADELEVTEVQTARDQASLQAVSVKNSAGKTQKLQAAALSRIVVGGQRVYDVLLDDQKKSYVLLDLARRDEVVAARLRPSRHVLWKELTDAEQAAAFQECKDYIERVGKAFPGRSFTLHETEYFLFYTDIPANQIGGYVASLDAMYAELCQLFGVGLSKNIWRGKCAVIAFLNQPDFNQFEAEFYQLQETGRAQGRCHSSGDGRVVIACYRGNDPGHFGAVLVHETAHGFLHRFRSTVFIPLWINEGIADYVAGIVVPAGRETVRRQKEAFQQMTARGTMLDLFETRDLQVVHFGVASSLTQHMISLSPTRYRALLTAIKEGATWKDAFRETYEISPEELARSYGRALGIADLRP